MVTLACATFGEERSLHKHAIEGAPPIALHWLSHLCLNFQCTFYTVIQPLRADVNHLRKFQTPLRW
jgi:hypothetical protein